MTEILEDNFAWLEGLCADDLQSPSEVFIVGGAITRGSFVSLLPDITVPELVVYRHQTLKVLEIAIGYKGKAPFRKRLFVAVLCENPAGHQLRTLATQIQPVIPS